jgi:peroxiredoxin Q/BCP
MANLKEGDPAPEISLPTDSGAPFELSSLKGKNVVLYFYPKADTPGCTTQACSIRDRGDEYSAAGVKVVGVSPDPVAKVKRFHDKRELNFTLLADPDHAVCDAYGVWVQKSMYGRKYMGAQRATFIIGPDGVVRHVIEKASPKTHDDEVLSAIGELELAS